MKKIIIVLLLVLSSKFAVATHQVSPVTKIKYIYTYNSYAVIKIANKTTNKDSCTYGRATEFLVVKYNDIGGKEMYSAALAAFMSGSKVRLAHTGCLPWGKTITIPKLYRVDVLK